MKPMHVGDPILDDAEDVGRDMKLQDEDCRMFAWGAPWLRDDLSEEEEMRAHWVLLMVCTPETEAEGDTWTYEVHLFQGEDDVVDAAIEDDWAAAKGHIRRFLRRTDVMDRDDVAEALAYINRQRRRAGLRPLDPERAGWSSRDVLFEAERLRMQNPDDQMGLFGPKQAEVEGFRLVSPEARGRGPAGPGMGTQAALPGVSRKVSREKMMEMRERELAERAERKKKRKGKKKRRKNPERWLAPRLTPTKRRRLKQLHDLYFPIFEEIESLPGATLETPTSEYTVPEGYALLFTADSQDYLFFQDEAPTETWTFVAVGDEKDEVEHLGDYLDVLERINAIVIGRVGPRADNPDVPSLLFHGTSRTELERLLSNVVARDLYFADVEAKAWDYAERAARQRDDLALLVVDATKLPGDLTVDPGVTQEEWDMEMGQWLYDGALPLPAIVAAYYVDWETDEPVDLRGRYGKC